MKTSAVLTAVLGLPLLASAAICNNNCGRAVAGSARVNPPFSVRQSQCAAFVSTTVTVTPGAVTVTANPVGARNVHGPRQASAPVITGTVPAYASSCADATAYWSACQCFSGISATTVTVTAATPVVTVTADVPSSTSPALSSTEVSSEPSTTEAFTTETSTSDITSTTDFPSESSTSEPATETSTSSEEPSSTTTTIGSTCTPSAVLPNPTTIITVGDDQFTSITLPFPITVFNSSESTVFVSINGRLSLFSSTTTYVNNPLPDTSIPAVSVLAFYDDLIIDPIQGNSVAYQVFGSAGNRTVTFEWITGRYGVPGQFYHLTTAFEEAAPGIIDFRYYSTSDKGFSATIGAQNLLDGGQSFVQYSYNTANAVPDRSFVRLDTTGSGTFTSGSFETTIC
ncbi:peptidase s8 and s53 subtilisin kexin sedolisin [Colletotrichum plurivorum]|uniref:Peptidase s8 and s53 subtilisin kexin sedolisin n=1 Tax=Colletotrichum plurivorum TaxID=2175906 RepID=A0A8H6K8S8_9PEZI|nr:peptidase s8 and s53 subtilisin kexin sedolisin [Colletotrichum plurivorum]